MDLGAVEDDAQREATYRFLNEEIGSQLTLLLEEARNLDTKATVVAGFAAAAVPFLLNSRREDLWWWALAAYVASFGMAFAALWPRRWDGLAPAALRDDLSEAAPVVVVGQVAGTKVKIFDRNKRRARSKALLWTMGSQRRVPCRGHGVVDSEHDQ